MCDGNDPWLVHHNTEHFGLSYKVIAMFILVALFYSMLSAALASTLKASLA